jgi:lipid-binding SYLF domain-containing protein
MRTTRSTFIILLSCMLAWLLMTPHLAANTPPAAPDEILRDATLVLRRALDTPSAAIPASIMARARGAAVFPAARTDGGMYYGLGVMSARGADPLRWTPPAVLNFCGTIPIDLDAASVDFVLVPLTRRGLDYLTQNQLSPVPMRIYPGPLGQETHERLDADLVGYMQFGDYFAGVSVERWTVVGMGSMNRELYRRAYSTDDIVRGAGFFNPPPAARAWLDALADYFREMS